MATQDWNDYITELRRRKDEARHLGGPEGSTVRISTESPDLQVAWPLTLMTGTGPTSAVYTVHSKELQEASDPKQLQRDLEARYGSQGSVYEAAAVGGVDDIIEPPETRRYLIRALAFLCQKQARSLGPKRRLFP